MPKLILRDLFFIVTLAAVLVWLAAAWWRSPAGPDVIIDGVYLEVSHQPK